MTKRHVPRKEREAVLAYAVDVMAALHMPRWIIMIMDEPCDADSQARVETLDQRWIGQIYLSRNWMKLDYDERRLCVTHEILHLLHRNLECAVVDDSRNLMHDWEHDDWTRRVKREFELMVDHLAMFLTDTHTLGQAWDLAHGKQTPQPPTQGDPA